MKLQPIVKYFYQLSLVAHLEHVNTRSYAKHEALGEFYGVVNSIKDRLIEYSIGKNYLDMIYLGEVSTAVSALELAQLTASAFCNIAEEMDDEALCNIAGEFEEAVGKLEYLYMFQ